MTSFGNVNLWLIIAPRVYCSHPTALLRSPSTAHSRFATHSLKSPRLNSSVGRWLHGYADDTQLCTGLSAGTWPLAWCEYERDGGRLLLALRQPTDRCWDVVVVGTPNLGSSSISTSRPGPAFCFLLSALVCVWRSRVT